MRRAAYRWQGIGSYVLCTPYIALDCDADMWLGGMSFGRSTQSTSERIALGIDTMASYLP